MKIISWNINSVRVRIEQLLELLRQEKPDIVCLQEIKCESGDFPHLDVRSLGYYAVVLGQKGYNGVAILSRDQPALVSDGLETDIGGLREARAISARLGSFDVLNVYVPNGDVVSSDKFDHKLKWLDALFESIDSKWFDDDPLIVCGDFNIAPEDEDTHDPAQWKSSVLCDPRVRKRLKTLEDWGLEDLGRGSHEFTWWDYRSQGFEKNEGLRIDLIMATAALKCTKIRVAKEFRGLEQPSDHAPVIAEFEAP